MKCAGILTLSLLLVIGFFVSAQKKSGGVKVDDYTKKLVKEMQNQG
jgi:hypothetical protein